MKVFTYIHTLLFSANEIAGEQSSTYWEQQVFLMFALILIPGGAYLSIAGALKFFSEGQPVFGFFNLCFYAASLVFLVVKSLPFTLRKRGILYVISFTGLSLLITTGPFGAALIFSIVGMVVAGLFESKKGLIFHNLLITFCLCVISFFLFHGNFAALPIVLLQDSWWIVMSNLLVIGILTSIVIRNVTSGLTRQSLLASEKEQDITTIYEAIQDPIIIFSTDYRVNRCNPAAEVFFGQSEMQLKEYFIQDFLHITTTTSEEDLTEKTLTLLTENIRKETTGHFKMKLHDGRTRDVLISITTLHKPASAKKEYLLFCKDISVETEALNQERQQTKMEAIGGLASGIAHDFNNMLGGIMGYTELLSTQLCENNEQMDYLNQILSACAQATTLIRRLQDFNRVSTDKFSVIDLHNVINTTIGLLSRSIDKSIFINLDLGAEKTFIMGDSVLLQNALLNLCINSRDAMPKGGSINIKTRNIMLTQEYVVKKSFPLQIQAGEYIEISIRDTGQGISEANQKKIFEPFFTTKIRGKGTGLGLTSVYTMIEKHEGVIRVKSTLEVGTEFIILLPGVILEKGEIDSRLSDKKKIRFDDVLEKLNGKVLLVDDEYIVRDATQAQLQSFGLSVVTANDGYSAIKLFRESPETITGIILDVNMPGLNGIQALLEMRKIDRNIPAVIYTGYTDKDIEKEILTIPGYQVLLRKPYSREELYQVMRDLNKKFKNAEKEKI